jgi:hypothetical protein
MRALRLSLVCTVTLGLVAVAAAPAHGQTGGATHVTGTISCARAAGGGTSQEDDSVRFDQFVGQCFAKLSDPRVSGGWRSDLQEVCFDLPGEPCMMFGPGEILGPDGTWVGRVGSINDATLKAMPAWGVYEGTGPYEGWTFVFFTPDQLVSSAETSGILYEGPPPPWGETLPLSPAEE